MRNRLDEREKKLFHIECVVLILFSAIFAVWDSIFSTDVVNVFTTTMSILILLNVINHLMNSIDSGFFRLQKLPYGALKFSKN